MSDLISRQAAIDALLGITAMRNTIPLDSAIFNIKKLPSAQPAQSEMIKEIRKWINSGNRGNADYFIVDKIEEIINAYEIN